MPLSKRAEYQWNMLHKGGIIIPFEILHYVRCVNGKSFTKTMDGIVPLQRSEKSLRQYMSIFRGWLSKFFFMLKNLFKIYNIPLRAIGAYDICINHRWPEVYWGSKDFFSKDHLASRLLMPETVCVHSVSRGISAQKRVNRLRM